MRGGRPVGAGRQFSIRGAVSNLPLSRTTSKFRQQVVNGLMSRRAWRSIASRLPPSGGGPRCASSAVPAWVADIIQASSGGVVGSLRYAALFRFCLLLRDSWISRAISLFQPGHALRKEIAYSAQKVRRNHIGQASPRW